jgi:hypothetical protein
MVSALIAMKIIRDCSRTIDTPLQRFVVQQHKVPEMPPSVTGAHPFVPPEHIEESTVPRPISSRAFDF